MLLSSLRRLPDPCVTRSDTCTGDPVTIGFFSYLKPFRLLHALLVMGANYC